MEPEDGQTSRHIRASAALVSVGALVARVGPSQATLLAKTHKRTRQVASGDQEVLAHHHERGGIAHYRRHDNRHTFASHLVSGGLSLEIIGRLLGHTNPTTTKRYTHLADDPLRAAASRFGDKIEGLRSGKKAEVVPMRPKV